eukprot:gene4789-4954_t
MIQTNKMGPNKSVTTSIHGSPTTAAISGHMSGNVSNLSSKFGGPAAQAFEKKEEKVSKPEGPGSQNVKAQAQAFGGSK